MDSQDLVHKASLGTYLRNIVKSKLAIAGTERILQVGCDSLVVIGSDQRLPVDLTHIIMGRHLNV